MATGRLRFPLRASNLWALNALEEAGYRYSSSTFADPP